MADEMKRPFGGVNYIGEEVGPKSGTIKWDGGAFGGFIFETGAGARKRFGWALNWHETFEEAAEHVQQVHRNAYEDRRAQVIAYEQSMPQERREEMGAILWHAFKAGFEAGLQNWHDVDDEWKAYLSELTP